MDETWVSVAAIAALSVGSFMLFLLLLGSGSQLPPEARSWAQRHIFVPASKVIGVLWFGFALFRIGEMAIHAWRTGGRSRIEDLSLGAVAVVILFSTYNLLKNNGSKLRAWLGRRPENSV